MKSWYQTYGRWALFLGFLQGLSPFAIDMYLPAMPSLAHDLQASIASVQASLMIFFVALGLAQWLYGPVSDFLGRRLPLLWGIAGFVVGSVGCALAPDVYTLMAMRFIQGLGSCAVIVIPRAVVRDLLEGHEAAQLMALLMLVFSVSPMIAPFMGTLIMQPWGWRGAFWVLSFLGLVALVMVYTRFQETHQGQEAHAQWSFSSAIAAYKQVINDRHFWMPALVSSWSFSTFMIFLSHSSFVFMNTKGLSAQAYSAVFAINALCFVMGAQIGPRWARKIGAVKQVKRASSVLMILACGHAVLQTGMSMPTLGLMIGTWVTFGALGLVLPSASVLTMEAQPRWAGTASSIMGSLQFLLGAAMIGVMSLLTPHSALPMLWAIASLALLAWGFAQWGLRTPRVAKMA